MAAILVGPASAKLVEQEETYTAGDTEMRGFIVYDDAVEGLRPGVLVVPEWWGLNDYARHRARMLAEQGYIAMAVDMYGNGAVMDNPGDAGEAATAVLSNPQLALSRMRAARALLDAQTRMDPARLAVIGYCFGGTIALNFARAGEDAKLIASFHGGLAAKTSARPGEIKARVIAYRGLADVTVPEEVVKAFKKEMKDAGADYKLIEYPDAKHGFTVVENDARAAEFNLPIGYNAAADANSWSDLLAELKTTFAPPAVEE
ncbi:MAG: dienelactone hydrolase family protein [Kiritimatiellae bacterium]|nr:dienelactone hydrolase family protein [Kiritimatiellia bacterium]